MSAIPVSGPRPTWVRPRGLVILALAAIAVVVIFLTKDDVDRYLFAAPLLVVGLMVSLAKWNDV